MKFSNVKRIIVEDFPKEDQETVSKLGFTINNVFEQLVQIFTKNLTIKDNLNEDLIPVTVSVNASGIPQAETLFKYLLKGKCAGIQVINASNQTAPAIYPTSQPFINFEQITTTTIKINHISGLQANNKYNLTLRVTGTG